MFETLAELVFGPIGFATVVVIGLGNTETGKRMLRNGVKAGVKAGYYAREKGSELFGELKEQTEDIVEEAKSERGNGHTKHHKAHS